MSWWFWLRKPVVEPTPKQERCGDSYHLWEGCPLTEFMRCLMCKYRPYLRPKAEAEAYKPMGWRE